MITTSTSFSKNVVIAKTSYQMLEILLYSRIGKGLLPPSTEISELTFVVKKYSEAFRGVYSRE